MVRGAKSVESQPSAGADHAAPHLSRRTPLSYWRLCPQLYFDKNMCIFETRSAFYIIKLAFTCGVPRRGGSVLGTVLVRYIRVIIEARMNINALSNIRIIQLEPVDSSRV